MAATQELMNEIQFFTTMVTQLSTALTQEGNATTPLVETAAVDNMNDVIILITDYLESIIPVPAP